MPTNTSRSTGSSRQSRKNLEAARKAAAKARRDKILKSPVVRVLVIVFAVGVLLTAGGFTFAANQEEHDAFCASCHTQPETTFFQRSTATAVDLASFHTAKSTRCIDCHSGMGVTGRISAEVMGAHNALLWYTNTAVQPAKLTQPVGDDNCIKCHLEVLNQQPTRNNHFHIFLARWQAADANAGGCTSCHQGHQTKASADTRWLEQATVEVVCQSCHRVIGEN